MGGSRRSWFMWGDPGGAGSYGGILEKMDHMGGSGRSWFIWGDPGGDGSYGGLPEKLVHGGGIWRRKFWTRVT